MEWEYLRCIEKKGNPFIEDVFYDIVRTESFEEGVNNQFLENIETNFDQNNLEITIKYNSENSIKAFMVFIVRITDPYFKWDFFILKEKIYPFNDFTEEKIFEIIGDTFINKENNIKIKVHNNDFFIYSKGLITYQITQDYEDTYFLNKELSRWKKIQNI